MPRLVSSPEAAGAAGDVERVRSTDVAGGDGAPGAVVKTPAATPKRRATDPASPAAKSACSASPAATAQSTLVSPPVGGTTLFTGAGDGSPWTFSEPASSPALLATSPLSADIPAPQSSERAPGDCASRSSSTSESLALRQQFVPLLNSPFEPPPAARPDVSRCSSASSVRSSPSSTRRRPPHHVFESPGATFVESVNGRRTLNQYTIKHVVGKGAFGTVSLAVDDEGNEWAIKECSKSRLRKRDHSNLVRGARGRGRGRGAGGFGGRGSRSSSEDQTDPWYLIREEIAIMKKLDHPNVVTLHEVLDDPTQDSLWMVFEMCHNGVSMHIDLDQDAVPFSEEQARYYFRQLVLGIEYLHANDICHRDVKPDNLLLTKENDLVIVDFGISQMFAGRSDCTKKSGGSPAFMAPEMCTPNGFVSGRSADLWAMGVTLYCFSFGGLPFKGRTIVDIFSAIRNDEPQFPPTCSPLLRDLLTKLLEKDMGKRITMKELTEHPWVTAQGSNPLPCMGKSGRVVDQVTEHDIKHAVRKIHSIYMVLKAVSKLRKSGSSTHQKNDPRAAEDWSAESAGSSSPRAAPDAASAIARLVLSDAPFTSEPEVSSVLGSADTCPDNAGGRSCSASSVVSAVSTPEPPNEPAASDEETASSANRAHEGRVLSAAGAAPGMPRAADSQGQHPAEKPLSQPEEYAGGQDVTLCSSP